MAADLLGRNWSVPANAQKPTVREKQTGPSWETPPRVVPAAKGCAGAGEETSWKSRARRGSPCQNSDRPTAAPAAMMALAGARTMRAIAARPQVAATAEVAEAMAAAEAKETTC